MTTESFVGKSYIDLVNTKRGYQIAILSLSIAVGVLSITAMNKQVEVIVMPPDYYEPVIVNGNYANESYAASHAVGIAGMIANVSERNADFVMQSFLKVLSPYLRNQVEATLTAETKILKTRKARQSFLIEDVMYDGKNNIVWVWGEKSLTFAGGGNHSERFTYEFRIEPKNGSPRVTHFDAYPGIPRAKDSKYKVEMLPYLSRELKLVKQIADPASKASYDVTPDPLADELEAQNPAASVTPNKPTEKSVAELPKDTGIKTKENPL